MNYFDSHMQTAGRSCGMSPKKQLFPLSSATPPKSPLPTVPTLVIFSRLAPHVISVHDELHHIAGILTQLPHCRLRNQLTQLLSYEGFQEMVGHSSREMGFWGSGRRVYGGRRIGL